MPKQIIYVNGYGAAGPNDGNYNMYLGKVRDFIREHPDTNYEVYLAGGFTNRTDLSEARAMEQWFAARDPLSNASFHLIENTTFARANIERFRELVGDEPVIIFCEFTRQHYMRAFANSNFTSSSVVPVGFDLRSIAFRRYLTTLFWTTPIEIGAMYSKKRKVLKPIEWLRAWLREGRIRQARRETKKR